MSKEQNFSATLGELDAGIFQKQLTEATKQVVLSAIESQKTGEVTLKLKIKPINDSGAVNVESSIATIEPKRKGRVRLDHATVTTMHATKTGFLSVSPDTQDDIFSTRDNVAPIKQVK